jgi:hypothetical protein
MGGSGLQARRVLLHRLSEIAGHEIVVIAEREMGLRSIGTDRGGTLRRGERCAGVPRVG